MGGEVLLARRHAITESEQHPAPGMPRLGCLRWSPACRKSSRAAGGVPMVHRVGRHLPTHLQGPR